MNTQNLDNQKAEEIIRSGISNAVKAAASISFGSISVEFVIHTGRIRKINYSATEKYQEGIYEQQK